MKFSKSYSKFKAKLVKEFMTNFIFAKSPQLIPIPAYRFTNHGPEVLILGGVHGDEYEGIVAAHGLLEAFLTSFPFKLNVTLVPTFNMEGVFAKTRTNSRGVDLNRNLPTSDWNPLAPNPRYAPGPAANSEPENQALVKFLKRYPPCLIVTLHSWFPLVNPNGDCMPEAECISKWTGYKIEADIGYPTPGSLGNYGNEQKIPVLTYEIQRDSAPIDIIKLHVPALIESLKVTEKRHASRTN